MMYQNQNWQNVPHYNYDQTMMVYQDPGPKSFYFWSAQYKLTIGNDGGYMGMQTDLSDNNGNNLGKGVLFALWGATQAQILNPNVIVHMNPDGSPGRSLLMPYAWEQGKAYRFRIWKLNSDSGGVWWQYSVLNISTNVLTVLGNLYYPNKLIMLGSWTVVWTEYYGPNAQTACLTSIRKPEGAAFFNPAMDGVTLVPISTSITTPACPNYLINQPAGWPGMANICTQQILIHSPNGQ